MTPHHLRIAAELLDFHRCPNTGRVLHSTKSDDKAFCRCGRPNPHLPNETLHAHFKEFMAKATVDDFVEQELWNNAVDRHLGKPFVTGGTVYTPHGDYRVDSDGKVTPIDAAEPTTKPPGSGGIMYVKDGRMWFKTSDGRNIPYPLISGEEDE
jgi:hypothetical protein